MNDAGKYALIKRDGWGENPGKWTLFEIGRETPQRVYQSPTKRAFPHQENWEPKARIVGRFDSGLEAQVFQRQVEAVWDAHTPAVDAADAALKAASAEKTRLNAERNQATRRALAIARGEAPADT